MSADDFAIINPYDNCHYVCLRFWDLIYVG